LPHNYKFLVIDIDGTVLNRQGRISVEDRQALDRARRAGMQISLSTGRSLGACLSIIGDLALDSYHIFFDGALVSLSCLSEEVYVSPISKTVVRQMTEFAHDREIDLELHSATHYFTERASWSTEAHRRFFGLEATIGDFDGIWERERIIKGGLVTTTPEEEAKAADFKLHFGNSIHFSQARTPAYPGVSFINILAPAVSKGRALEVLASYLGISLTEVIAVGDGTNDISLLATAGLGIAMGNAHEEVKRVADYITLDVENSGLAAAIHRFLL
jgi:Cof subfamily protein (haloacid dehalogenase superfamily)